MCIKWWERVCTHHRMSQTTVSEVEYEDANGRERTQYRTTVPKELAEALELGNASVEWKVESANSLSLTKVE